MTLNDTQLLLSVRNLIKHYSITENDGFLKQKKGLVRAIDDVSFDIVKGETLGLVGESGSGKTTVGRTILQLTLPTSGKVIFDGVDLAAIEDEQLRQLRKRMQIIFQDSYSSLNNRMTIQEIISEPLETFELMPRKDMSKKVDQLLELVGLPTSFATRNPHEFSGGQRQRIGIARALAVSPEFIVCDEPTSALDVSVQAKILNLLSSLKKDLNLTYLFISHDLSVIRHICDRVAVMYMGKIVEIATTDELFNSPKHPYTKTLMASVPEPDPEMMRNQESQSVPAGDPPSPFKTRIGCAFYNRCAEAKDLCKTEHPALKKLGPNNKTACHLF